MGSDQLLEEYIAHLQSLKKELDLGKVIYARKTTHELRHNDPALNIPLIAEGKNEKEFRFLENGEVFYYKIHKENETFCAVLCRKASQSAVKSYHNDIKTYRAIANSENPEKIDPFLFKNHEILTIDDAIKRIEILRG